MGRQSNIFAFNVFAAIGALAASLAVLALGAVIFGPELSQWAEWKGRVIGVLGTIAGVGGAAAGFQLARGRKS